MADENPPPKTEDAAAAAQSIDSTPASDAALEDVSGGNPLVTEFVGRLYNVANTRKVESFFDAPFGREG
ncbi:hypothetical protein ACLBXM_08275 [Xanthobacteraceae bacterium A53D]